MVSLAPTPATAQSSSSVPTRAHPARILLVDSDEQTIIGFSDALERQGWQVCVASDDSAALSLIAAVHFDLLFAAVDSPDLDGIELLRRIRQVNTETPVVLLTDARHVHTAISAVNHGANGYLPKLLAPDELVQHAGRLIGALRGQCHQSRSLETGSSERAPAAEAAARFERALSSVYIEFQPVVHLPELSVPAYQALVRSAEPSVPGPDVLFELAEALGETRRLGKVIRQRCAEALANAPPGSMLFINLHADDLDDPSLLHTAGPLAPYAPRIVLEITKRAQLSNLERASEPVRRLRDFGYRIAIDDIGAGYASLNSFALLEPDVAKIDMGLVRDVDTSRTKQGVIQALVRFCHGAGIDVIAEGVETQAEFETLARLGCTLLQGLLFASPIAGPSAHADGSILRPKRILAQSLRTTGVGASGERPQQPSTAGTLVAAAGRESSNHAGEPLEGVATPHTQKGIRIMNQPHRPPTEEEIRKLAHHLWCERGCPEGSPEVDWIAARFQLEANLALRQAQGAGAEGVPPSSRSLPRPTSDGRDRWWFTSP